MNRYVLGKFAKKVGIGTIKVAGFVVAVELLAAVIDLLPSLSGSILGGALELMFIAIAVISIGGVLALYLRYWMREAHKEYDKERQVKKSYVEVVTCGRKVVSVGPKKELIPVVDYSMIGASIVPEESEK